MKDAPSASHALRATALERRFVARLAAVLLAAAALVNLPSAVELAWTRPAFQALLWAATALILRSAWPAQRAKQRSERTVLAALGVVALFAAASHVRFGRFHGAWGEGRFLHHHELFNYTLGSKYFPELGYDGLYYATHRALLENDPALAQRIVLVKNLRTNRFESANVSLQRADSVEALFTEARWSEFRRDVRFFQSLIGPERWTFLLADHGYNATPAWTALGAFFTRRMELGARTLWALAALDPLLIALTLLVARYGFGSRAALLFAIFFFANCFSTFEFTGGAFLRQVWVAGLVGFAAFLRRGRPTAAGACLAVSAADRVFPVLFLIVPLALLLRAALRRVAPRRERFLEGERADLRGPLRLCAAFALVLAAFGVLGALSAGGPSAWIECYENLREHNRGIYLNQISLRTLFLVDPLAALRLAGGAWDESLWLRAREARDVAARVPLAVLRTAAMALLVAAVAARKRPLGALGLVAFAPFVLLYPADYYCIFFGLALLAWREARGLALASVLAQAVFWLLHAALPSPLQLEALHWLISAGLAALFGAFLAADLACAARAWPALRWVALATAAAGAAGAAALGLLRPSDERAQRILDLSTADVSAIENASAANESTAAWGTAWARDDQLRIDGRSAGARVRIDVEAEFSGPHRLRVDYGTAPPFGEVMLRVNGEPYAPIELGAPRIALYSAVYRDVALREGANELELSAQKPEAAGAARGPLFAVDRLVVGPCGPLPSAAAALERALGWILAHPADAFDGGPRDARAEIVALDRIARSPALRDVSISALASRVAWLNEVRSYRARTDEYDLLAAAAHAARRHGLGLLAFDANADALRRFAESQASAAGFRPLFLCTYLQRLDAGGPACELEQSLVHHEHAERTLSKILRGPVDRSQAPDLARALGSILADVVALTDGGAEELPARDAFANGAPWADLVEDGLRWAREAGDVRFCADLLFLASLLGVRAEVPSYSSELARLIENQEAEGSFGAADPRRPNPRRDAVLAAASALAASLDPSGG